MFMSTLYGLIPSDVIETIESLRRMRKRQVGTPSGYYSVRASVALDISDGPLTTYALVSPPTVQLCKLSPCRPHGLEGLVRPDEQ